MLAFTKAVNHPFTPQSYSHFPSCTWPNCEASWQWDMKSTCVRVLFLNQGNTKVDERAGGVTNWKVESWLFLLFFLYFLFFSTPAPGRNYSRKQTSKGKLQWGPELENMWWGINEKEKKKKTKERKRSLFVSEGVLWKNTSNYNTFHIYFTMGSFTLYPTPGRILQCYEKKVRGMQMDQKLVVWQPPERSKWVREAPLDSLSSFN